ncbi:ParB/RepB/Spo0J family partition protein [Kitasatospora sp. NPDC127060]|uniref:ParB/RepB/Spo0J family partition protein n=1 Tax=Kitasatospora sp. NPDC127060 TaxID=3347121 RepID=UPI00364A3296
MTITTPENVTVETRTADGLLYRSIGELHYLDPRKLVLDEYNVRTEETDPDEAMLESVEADGVETPLLVRPFLDGTYGVVAGQRRMLSAQAAAQKCIDEGRERDIRAVPCMVRADLIGQSAEVIAAAVAKSLQENLLRRAMTSADVASAAEQLDLLGLSDEELKKAATTAGLTVEQIKQARRATSLPKEVKREAAQHEFDLDELIALAEVEGVPGAVEELARAREEDAESGSADKGNWQHAMQSLRRQKAERAVKDAARAEWKGKGLVELPRRSWYEQPGITDRLLRDLVDANGEPIDPEKHSAQCPGKAFVFEWSDEVVFACADWRANKHKRADLARKAKGDGPSPSEVASKNKAEADARTVRGKFVKKIVTEKLSDRAMALAMQVVTEMPSWYADAVSPGNVELIAAYFNEPCQRVTRATPRGFFNALNARLRRNRRTFNAVFAQVAMAFELHMSRKKHWAVADGWTADWLRFLRAEGYTLAAIEKEMVAAVEKKEKAEAKAAKARPQEPAQPETPDNEDDQADESEEAEDVPGTKVQPEQEEGQAKDEDAQEPEVQEDDLNEEQPQA